MTPSQLPSMFLHMPQILLSLFFAVLLMSCTGFLCWLWGLVYLPFFKSWHRSLHRSGQFQSFIVDVSGAPSCPIWLASPSYLGPIHIVGTHWGEFNITTNNFVVDFEKRMTLSHKRLWVVMLNMEYLPNLVQLRIQGSITKTIAIMETWKLLGCSNFAKTVTMQHYQKVWDALV